MVFTKAKKGVLFWLESKNINNKEVTMVYANPGSEGAVVQFKPQYENYIGGQWVAPVDGSYFDNVSPVNGEPFCKIPRSTEADINLALDAAHSA